MNKEIIEKLRRIGVDTESAIERFMGNEALYTKFALRFIDDKNSLLTRWRPAMGKRRSQRLMR